MVNSQVTQEIVNALKLDSNVEIIPLPVPVIEVGVKGVLNGRSVVASKILTGDLNVFLVPAIGDTYLTSFSMQVVKDATCNKATGTIDLVISSDNNIITFSIPVLVTTASNNTLVVTFEHPLKLTKEYQIVMTGTYALGLMSRVATLNYFIDEVS